MKDQLDPPDLLALLVSVVPQGRVVPSAPQADLAPRGLLEQLERREFPAGKVQLGRQVVTGFRVWWVCPGQRDPWGPQERTGTRVRSESMDRRVPKEARESMVPLGPQVQWVQSDSPEPLVLMVSLAPGVSRVRSEQRETRAPEGSPVLPAQLDCRVCLVHQERKERLETWAPWAPQVPRAPEVQLAPVELTVHKVPLEVWVTLVM